jgi:hypothetical protein
MVREFVSRFVPLLKESLASAPENPRLLWVYGPTQWYAPPGTSAEDVDRRQKAALATYDRALALTRATRTTPDALEPSWGEAELLMSLAWSSLNRTTPDPRSADTYARQALHLVPHWRYVRDILMPQIRRALDAGAPDNGPSAAGPPRRR